MEVRYNFKAVPVRVHSEKNVRAYMSGTDTPKPEGKPQPAPIAPGDEDTGDWADDAGLPKGQQKGDKPHGKSGKDKQ